MFSRHFAVLLMALGVFILATPAKAAEPTLASQLVNTFTDGTVQAVAANSTHAIAGKSNGLLEVWDISSLAAPVKLSQENAGWDIQAIAMTGSTVYVFSYDATQFRVFDLTNPTDIKTTTTVKTGDLSHCVGARIVGNMLYAWGKDYEAGTRGTLEAYSIATLSAPVLQGSYTYPQNNTYFRDIHFEGTTAYVAAESLGLLILDIANPAGMTKLGEVASAYNYNLTSIAKKDNYVFTGSSHSGLSIYNAANTAQPTVVGTKSELTFMTVSSMLLDDDTLYMRGDISVDSQDVQVLALATVNGSDLTMKENVQVAGPGSDTESGTILVDGLVYTTGTGVSIIAPKAISVDEGSTYNFDLGLTNPQSYSYTLQTTPDNLGASVTNGTVFIPAQADNSTGYHKLTVTATGTETKTFEYDVFIKNLNTAPTLSVPSEPVTSGWNTPLVYNIPTTDNDLNASGYIEELQYSIDQASLAKGMAINMENGQLTWTPSKSHVGSHTVSVTVTDKAGLSDTQNLAIRIFDISRTIRAVGGFSKDTTYSVMVANNTAYVGGWGVLETWDISDIASPVKLDSVEIEHPTDQYSTEIVLNISLYGDYAFIQTYHALNVVNVADPENISVIKTITHETLNTLRGMHIANDRLALCGFISGGNSKGGFAIYSLQDPTEPTLLGSYLQDSSGQYFNAIYLVDDLAFIGTHSPSTRVYDISNPAAPKQILEGDEYKSVTDFTRYNNILYASREHAGYEIYDVSIANAPDKEEPVEDYEGNWYSTVASNGKLFLNGKKDGSSSVGWLRVVDLERSTKPVLATIEMPYGVQESGVDTWNDVALASSSKGITLVDTQVLSIAEGEAFSFEVPVLDASTYSWTADARAQELGITVSNGVVSVPAMQNGQTGYHTFAINSTNAGNQTEHSFSLQVDNVNTAPVIANTNMSTTFFWGVPNVLQVLVDDADLLATGYTETLAYTIDSASVVKGLSIDQKGQLYWSPEFSAQGTQTSVTVTVTDAAGLSDNATFILSVGSPTGDAEPNNKPSSASPLQPGTPALGDLSDDAATDYFSFTLNENQLITLSAVTKGTAGYNVELLSADSNTTVADIISDDRGLLSYNATYTAESTIEVNSTQYENINGMAVDGKYLFIWGWGDYNGEWTNILRIYPIDSTDTPLWEGKLDSNGGFYHFEAEGNTMYLHNDGRVRIIDMSDPQNPTIAKQDNLPDWYQFSAWNEFTFTMQNYTSTSIQVYQRSLTGVTKLGSFTLENGVTGSEILAGGGLLFVRDNAVYQRYQVYDVTNPEAPVLLRTIEGFGDVRATNDRYVWFAQGSTLNLFAIDDFRLNSSPTPLSSLTIGSAGFGTILPGMPFFAVSSGTTITTVHVDSQGKMHQVASVTDVGFLKAIAQNTGRLVLSSMENFYTDAVFTPMNLNVDSGAWAYERFTLPESNNSTTVKADSATVGLEPGTYYVKITPDGEQESTQSYAVTYTPLGVFSDPGSAFSLIPGQASNGTIYSLLDTNTYSLGVTSASATHLVFNNDSAFSDYRLSLFDSHDQLLQQFNLQAGEDVDAWVNLSEDTYTFLLEILNNVDASQDYELVATTGNGLSVTLETEPNNDRTQANRMLFDEPMQGRIADNKDDDLYIVELAVATSFDISFDSTGQDQLNGTFMLSVEAGGKVIDYVQITANEKSVLPMALFPGKYILRVSGKGVDSSDPYQLILTDAGAMDREYEPNNTPKFANGIQASSKKVCRLYSSTDKDFYVVDMTTSGWLIAQLDNNDGSASMTARIENLAGTSIGTVQAEAGQQKSGQFYLTNPGLYYIAVTGSDISTGLYDFTVSGSMETVRELIDVTATNGTGSELTLAPGESATLNMYASYSDGYVEDVTANATWTSTNPTVADVSTGVVGTGTSEGTATIMGSFFGRTSQVPVLVTSGQQQNSTTVQQQYGNLIIVAGGGVSESNQLKDTTQFLCDLAYSKFVQRGFEDEDIYYINPIAYKDLDGDGFDDQIVDSTNATSTEFVNAVSQWAKNTSSTGPLTIYLNDHGAEDQFQIDQGQILTASVLDSILDDFQTQTGRKVIVIIEACHSGTFVDDLTTNVPSAGRLVLTSSDEDVSYLGAGGTPSFSLFLIDALYKGADYQSAFDTASSSMSSSGKPYSGQAPQLEGASISAESEYVVGNFALAPLFPEIPDADIAVPSTATFGQPFTFSAKVTGVTGGSVWATIKPLGYTPPAVAGDFVTPEIQIPSVTMADESNNAFDSVYEATYSGFATSGDYQTNGVYEVIIYAKDKNQNITTSTIKYVTLSGGSASTDNAFPVAQFTVSNASPDLDETVVFTDASSDSDGQIASRFWDFGNGQNSTEVNPSISYNATGSFAVTLTVTDDKNATATFIKYINVGGSQSTDTSTIAITTGWNLISLPVEPATGTPAVVFSGNLESVVSVWKFVDNNWAVYLPSESATDFQNYLNAKGFTELSSIGSGEGVWVSATQAFNMNVAGATPTPGLKTAKNWNLLGVRGKDSKPVGTMFDTNKENVTSVWTFSNGNWSVYLPNEADGGQSFATSMGFNKLSTIQPGQGFWVNCKASIDLQ